MRMMRKQFCSIVPKCLPTQEITSGWGTSAEKETSRWENPWISWDHCSWCSAIFASVIVSRRRGKKKKALPSLQIVGIPSISRRSMFCDSLAPFTHPSDLSLPLPPLFGGITTIAGAAVAAATGLMIALNRQIHPHPPRRQPNPLLLIHVHSGVVPLQQRDVHALRAHIPHHLIGMLQTTSVVVVVVVMMMMLL